MTDPTILRPEDTATLVSEMDLTLDGLRTVARYADAERAVLISAHDTPGLDQAMVYHRLGRGLRDVFCGPHWEVDNSDNHTAIKHRTKPLRIVPCNFDENTGNLLIQPRNRTNKGEVMKRRTMCNATSFLFHPDDLPIRHQDGRVTWLLGAYSFNEEPLRAELCLPVAFTEKHITSLNKRIIVLDGSEQPDAGRSKEEPVEIVDIKIEPRG